MNSKLKLLAVVVWFNWKSARNYHTPQYTVTSVKLEFTWAICSVRKNPCEFCPILVYVFSFDAFVTLSSLLWLLCQMKLFHFGHQSYITGTYFQFGLDIFDILWCESMYVSCGKKKKMPLLSQGCCTWIKSFVESKQWDLQRIFSFFNLWTIVL
jgi:hypothetical protein